MSEIIEWVKNYETTKEHIKLNQCSTVICQDQFISTQISIVENSKSKKAKELAMERLRLFKDAIEQQGN